MANGPRASALRRRRRPQALLLPLVAACIRQVDLDAGRIHIARGFAEPSYPD